jgi:hypothetical protein
LLTNIICQLLLLLRLHCHRLLLRLLHYRHRLLLRLLHYRHRLLLRLLHYRHRLLHYCHHDYDGYDDHNNSSLYVQTPTADLTLL